MGVGRDSAGAGGTLQGSPAPLRQFPAQQNSPCSDRVSGRAGVLVFMEVGGEGSARGERHSPGESGSSPAVPCAIKQPLLRPGFRLGGGCGVYGVDEGGLCREAALSGGVRLPSDDFLRNKTAPAQTGMFRLGGGCFQFRGGFTRASCPVYYCMRSNGGRGTGAQSSPHSSPSGSAPKPASGRSPDGWSGT